jgi:hypothetical protein
MHFKPTSNTTPSYYRLVALWVLCEALLGGIIHGLKLPISGLLVGSASVTIICLIGYYVPNKSSILKATITVAVFKMMMSPHSPPTAYLAVFFQGIVGQLLFLQKRWYKFNCMLLAVLALFESAVQRILVLLLLYGQTFWKAVDAFIQKVTGSNFINHYSLYLSLAYICMHLVVGVLLGWVVGLLPKRIEQWRTNTNSISITNQHKDTLANTKRKKQKWGLLALWLLLAILYIQQLLPFGKPLLTADTVLAIFLRSVLILLSWYILFKPVVTYMLHKWLTKKRVQEQATIQQVQQLLPSVKELVKQSWLYASKQHTGWKKYRFFCRLLIVNIIYAA